MVEDQRPPKNVKKSVTTETSSRGDAFQLSEHVKNAKRFFQLNEGAKYTNKNLATNHWEGADEEEEVDDMSAMQPSKVWSWF